MSTASPFYTVTQPQHIFKSHLLCQLYLHFKATKGFYPFHNSSLLSNGLHYRGHYDQAFCNASSHTGMPCRLFSLLFLLNHLYFCPRGSLSSIHTLNFIPSHAVFQLYMPTARLLTFSCLENLHVDVQCTL